MSGKLPRLGNTSSAVREQRAPQLVAADDETRARWRRHDWFATPPFASRAGAELVRALDPHAASSWDPACGDGIMAECFKEYDWEVAASDICSETGYGQELDFLSGHHAPACDWIITNPPFDHAADFVRIALGIARTGVAVLCRMAFLETVGRYPLHVGENGLAVFAPFAERVPMQLGPWYPKCSTATAYAWFVYFADGQRRAEAATRIIPPGTRARLSLPDDVRRFCAASDAPLFEGA